MEQADNRKKKKEPDTTTIAFFAAGAAIVCVITLFGISAFLRLNTIIVEGYVVYTPDLVAEASNVSKGDNLLYLSRDNAAQSIKDELPYIDSVEITKEFPDILIIEVTESTPVAYIPHAGNALIIDSAGRTLDVISSVFGTAVEARGNRLIEVRGVPVSSAEEGKPPVVELGSETSYRAMQDILAIIEREGIAQDINYLDVANITNISFGYLDKYRVVVGGLLDFRVKLINLPNIINDVQLRYTENVSGELNLTNPSGEYGFSPD